MELILKDLGEHPVVSGVTVSLDLRGLSLDLDREALNLPYRLRYYKDGVEITEKFTNLVPNWEIRNNHLMMVRDQNFEPIPNPDYVEQVDEEGNITNKEEMYLREPAFDYMARIIYMLLGEMVKRYIEEEHADKKFLG